MVAPGMRARPAHRPAPHTPRNAAGAARRWTCSRSDSPARARAFRRAAPAPRCGANGPACARRGAGRHRSARRGWRSRKTPRHLRTRSATVTSNPSSAPKACKSVAVPARPLPKQKSAPITTWRMPKPFVQHLHREIAGGKLRQRGVERQFIQPLHPQHFQPVGAGLGVHQSEGRSIGVKKFARVRLERDNAQAGRHPAGPCRSRRGGPDAARRNCPWRPTRRARGVKPCPVVENLHLPSRGKCAP